MKKIILLTTAIMLSMNAFAQDEGQQDNQAPKKTVKYMGHGPVIPKNAGNVTGFYYGIPDLTDAQKASIDKLRTALNKDMRKVENQIKEKKARLNSLQDEEKVDQKAVHKTIDEITALQGQTMKLRADFRIKMDEQLNEEQKEAFRQNSNKIQGMVHNRTLRMTNNNGDVTVHTDED